VLEGGKFVIHGTRDAVRNDARVVEAYLGQVKSRGLAR
jgi:ABC-type branched-subunit amino acid transport system ATPase component